MYRGTLDPVSNAEDWTGNLDCFDDDDGDPYFTESDTGSHPDEVTMKLRDQCGAIVLTGSLTGGDLVIVGDGIIQFTFPSDRMGGVCPGTYEIGVTYQTSDATKQIILGRLPVLRGL